MALVQLVNIFLVTPRDCQDVVAVKFKAGISGAGEISHGRVPFALFGSISAAGFEFYAGRGKSIANIPWVGRSSARQSGNFVFVSHPSRGYKLRRTHSAAPANLLAVSFHGAG